MTMLLFAMLSTFVMWLALQPVSEWEIKSLKIPGEVTTAEVGRDEIFQTMYAPAGIRGISVLLSDHRNEVGGTWLFTLYNERGEAVDHAVLRGADILYYEYADVVFQAAHEPGHYKVGARRGPDATGRLSIYESQGDSYKDGESIDAELEKKNVDWCFRLLVPFSRGLIFRHHAYRFAGVILSVLLLFAGLFLAFDRQQFLSGAFNGKWTAFAGKYVRWLLPLLLVALPAILYMDYLTGDRYYIFNLLDRGADSAAQTYPSLLALARRLPAGRLGSFFNFRLGLGAAENAYFPTLTNWVALFGEKNVALLMGVSQWLKVVLSGLLAFAYAREFGTGDAFAFAAAVGYEFNAMLIDRGAWESYPNLSLLVILWLYVYERSRKKKRYLLFGLVTLLFFSGVVLYDCVFYAALLGGYLLLRNFLLDGSGREEGKLRRVGTELAVYIAFWFFGSIDTLRTLLMQAIRSDRMSDGVSQYASLAPDEIWSDVQVWATAFLRTIGHSITGITENAGSHNLLEGPAFYCGILAFLLLPLALLFVKGKKRIGYLVCVAAALFYIACVPFRLLTSGFAKDTFKLSSFWITLVMFLLLLELFAALNAGERPGRRIGAVALAAACTGWLVARTVRDGYAVNRTALICSVVMIAFYTVLALSGSVLGRRTFLFLLCAGVCAEGVAVTADMVWDRQTYSKMEMTYNGYQDTSAAVIAELRAQDEGWYRIEKQFDSEFLSDSLAQDYYGTKSYVGGTEIAGGVLDLYEAYDLPRDGEHYLEGSSSNVCFSALAGVRYCLAKERSLPKYGYRFVRGEGEVNVFENELALPLFYVSEDDAPLRIDTDRFKEKGVPVSYVRSEEVLDFREAVKDKAVLMDMKFSEQALAYLHLHKADGEVTEFPFMMRDRVKLVLYMDNVVSLWLSKSAARRLDGMDIYAMDPLLCYEAFADRIRAEQASVSGIQVLGENSFAGTVSAAQDSYLATAIPYDPNWEIRVDGESCPVMPVRGGFLGAKIGPGEHAVEIAYPQGNALAQNLGRLIGALVLGVWLCLRIAARKKARGKREAGRKETGAGEKKAEAGR